MSECPNVECTKIFRSLLASVEECFCVVVVVVAMPKLSFVLLHIYFKFCDGQCRRGTAVTTSENEDRQYEPEARNSVRADGRLVIDFCARSASPFCV